MKEKERAPRGENTSGTRERFGTGGLWQVPEITGERGRAGKTKPIGGSPGRTLHAGVR